MQYFNITTILIYLILRHQLIIIKLQVGKRYLLNLSRFLDFLFCNVQFLVESLHTLIINEQTPGMVALPLYFPKKFRSVKLAVTGLKTVT